MRATGDLGKKTVYCRPAGPAPAQPVFPILAEVILFAKRKKRSRYVLLLEGMGQWTRARKQKKNSRALSVLRHLEGYRYLPADHSSPQPKPGLLPSPRQRHLHPLRWSRTRQ